MTCHRSILRAVIGSLALVWAIPCLSQGLCRQSNGSVSSIDSVADSTLSEYLRLWKADVTGCLGMRDDRRAAVIACRLNLRHRPLDSILALLGPPTVVLLRRLYYPAVGHDEEYLLLQYNYDVTRCVDGIPAYRTSRCWLEIVVSQQQCRSVEVSRPCGCG